MRTIYAALLMLGACATAGPPPERLAGCWISRGDGAARTMRWLPDPGRPGVLRGEMIVYGAGGAVESSRFTLEPREAGWGFCAHEGEGAPRCRAVAQGERGSLEGGRVFIDAYRDHLRISMVGDGPERIVFRGRRDGCD